MTDKRLRPRKQPGQQRAVETRQRLLAAAARVFSRHGYAAGTTNRIAEEASHSIGTLYQYFPTKDAILVELVRAHVREGTAEIENRLASGELPTSLEGRIRWFVRAAIDNHRDDPALHQVLFEQAPRPAEMLVELHAAEDRAVTMTAALLASDPTVGVADTDTAARLVVHTVESSVHRFVARAERGDRVELRRFEDELVAMLTRYLTGSPSIGRAHAEG